MIASQQKSRPYVCTLHTNNSSRTPQTSATKSWMHHACITISCMRAAVVVGGSGFVAWRNELIPMSRTRTWSSIHASDIPSSPL